MHKAFALCAAATLLVPFNGSADPLDYESYTHQPAKNFWMSNGDLAWLLVDYGLFAVALVALGWLAYAKPAYWQRLEKGIRYPFDCIHRTAQAHGGVNKVSGLLLYSFNICLIFVSLAVWIFLCQWIKHEGFGGLSMAGLALAAVFLVRALGSRNKQA